MFYMCSVRRTHIKHINCPSDASFLMFVFVLSFVKSIENANKRIRNNIIYYFLFKYIQENSNRNLCWGASAEVTTSGTWGSCDARTSHDSCRSWAGAGQLSRGASEICYVFKIIEKLGIFIRIYKTRPLLHVITTGTRAHTGYPALHEWVTTTAGARAGGGHFSRGASADTFYLNIFEYIWIK